MAEPPEESEEWREEKEALCAIFGDEVSLRGPSHVTLHLSHEEGFESLQLDFRIQDGYPATIPVISVQCEPKFP